jgi:hypothetical protein
MKTVSIISIVYGVLGLIWAAAVNFIIRLQAAFFENFPWPPETYEYVDVPVLLESVYSVIGTVFPFVFLIAILYIISGILQLAGKSSFQNIAYAAAILNILWYVAYVVLLQVEVVPTLGSIEFFPKNLMHVLITLAMIINGIFYCGYPIFLIIYINRGGKEWDTLDTEYTS